MLVIEPTFQAHGWPAHIDLDFFNVCKIFIVPELEKLTKPAAGRQCSVHYQLPSGTYSKRPCRWR